MSSTRVLRITSIFIAAFLFGLAWVGIFRLFHGLFFENTAATARPKAVERYPAPKAAPEVSMEDSGFTPPSVDETNPEAFDPEGIYTIDGDVDPAFSDFDLFTINNKKLDVECDAKDFGALISPTGFAFETNANTEHGTKWPFDSLRISNGKIKFVTEAVNGTSFAFDGDFTVKGNFYTLDPDARVLEGKLIKFLNGRKVAETEVGFTWSIDLECVC